VLSSKDTVEDDSMVTNPHSDAPSIL